MSALNANPECLEGCGREYSFFANETENCYEGAPCPGCQEDAEEAKANVHCTECDSVSFRYLYNPGEGDSSDLVICVDCGADAPANVTDAQMIDG